MTDEANPKRARDKKQPEPKAAKALTDDERVEHVFLSQGRAARQAEHLPPDYKKRVAALCDGNGLVSPKAPTELVTILRELGKENKAEVDGLTDEKSDKK